MILDVQPSTSFNTPSQYDEVQSTSPSDDPSQPGLRQLHVKPILQLVLQDAQTRLLFKAQAVIQSDIRSYIPKDNDLAYPDKIMGKQRGPLSYSV